MARAIVLITILIVLVGGWMFFRPTDALEQDIGGPEESAEVPEEEQEVTLIEEPKKETEPPKPPEPKPMEEFLPTSVGSLSLVSYRYMKVSDELHDLAGGYEGGFDFTISNCSTDAKAEEMMEVWDRLYGQENEPTIISLNDLPANQFVDVDSVPKAYSWRDGNFVFAISKSQADPDGNLLKIAKAIGRQ